MNTWGMRKTVGAIAVAAAVAGVGGAAIAAATGNGYHAVSGGMQAFGGPPPTTHRSSSEPDAVHGEYVVADGNGGFSTVVSQTGRVTAISATSVTARSDDGFVQTYAIHGADGIATPPFAVGDQIVIDATRKGETATVSTMRPPLSPGH